MFKNSRIKKLFMLSFISTYIFSFGTNVSASVIKRRNSFNGVNSKKTRPSLRRCVSLSYLKETSTRGFEFPYKVIGTDKKLTPFLEIEDPGDIQGGYSPQITFDRGRPIFFFTGRNEEGQPIILHPNYVANRVYIVRGEKIYDELSRQYQRVIQDNNF